MIFKVRISGWWRVSIWFYFIDFVWVFIYKIDGVLGYYGVVFGVIFYIVYFCIFINFREYVFFY